jgi:hypothetical protein
LRKKPHWPYTRQALFPIRKKKGVNLKFRRKPGRAEVNRPNTILGVFYPGVIGLVVCVTTSEVYDYYCIGGELEERPTKPQGAPRLSHTNAEWHSGLD